MSFVVFIAVLLFVWGPASHAGSNYLSSTTQGNISSAQGVSLEKFIQKDVDIIVSCLINTGRYPASPEVISAYIEERLKKRVFTPARKYQWTHDPRVPDLAKAENMKPAVRKILESSSYYLKIKLKKDELLRLSQSSNPVVYQGAFMNLVVCFRDGVGFYRQVQLRFNESCKMLQSMPCEYYWRTINECITDFIQELECEFLACNVNYGVPYIQSTFKLQYL